MTRIENAHWNSSNEHVDNNYISSKVLTTVMFQAWDFLMHFVFTHVKFICSGKGTKSEDI